MKEQQIEKAINYIHNIMTETDIYCGQSKMSEEDKEYLEMLQIAVNILKHQLTNGWIPVSDRLPQIRSCEDGEPIEYNIMLKGAEVPTTGCINDDGVWGEMCWAKGIFYPFANEVIAWQPLPEPYKELATDNNVVIKPGKDNNVLTIGDKIRERVTSV